MTKLSYIIKCGYGEKKKKKKGDRPDETSCRSHWSGPVRLGRRGRESVKKIGKKKGTTRVRPGEGLTWVVPKMSKSVSVRSLTSGTPH